MSPSKSFTHKLKSLRVTILLSSFHDSMSKTKSAKALVNSSFVNLAPENLDGIKTLGFLGRTLSKQILDGYVY